METEETLKYLPPVIKDIDVNPLKQVSGFVLQVKHTHTLNSQHAHKNLSKVKMLKIKC